MYPDYTYTPSPSVIKKRRIAAAILLAVIILAFGAWSLWRRVNTAPEQGTVNVLYSPSGISSVSIDLNGKQYQPAASPVSYKLAAGSYTLKITSPGFKDFSATVPVTSGQTVAVNAQLTPTGSLTITGPYDILLPGEIPSIQILDTQYFYNNSWALLHVNTPYDSDALLVVRRSNQSPGKWDTIAGPGLAFSPDDIIPLPSLIQQYLDDNGFVEYGD